MYVYIKSEQYLWTVGFYSPDGKWIPANTVTFESGAVGRAGISGTQINWDITGRR